MRRPQRLVDLLARTRLQALVDALPRLRIAVVGDYFLDAYYDCDPQLDEPSLETGKTARQVIQRIRQRLKIMRPHKIA